MNLLNILRRKELIAGLEISDLFVRLVLLDTNKEGVKSVKALVEQPLPDGAIINGAVNDHVKFVATLKNLTGKLPIKVEYVIASIPADKIYVQNLKFPSSLVGSKLTDAIKLALDYQLPFKRETAYVDWQRIDSSEWQEFLVTAIPKEVSNGYIKDIALAGLKLVALEFHPLSILRAADLPSNQDTLVKYFSKTSSSVFAAKSGGLKFSRVVPQVIESKKDFDREVSEIADFYESEYNTSVKTVDFSALKLKKELNLAVFGKEPSRWLVASGASLRGQVPRSDDSFISLLPIGTEKAYQYQKASMFFEFISSFTIGLSVFFVLVFLGVWLFMLSIQQSSANSGGQGAIVVPPDVANAEARTRDAAQLFNTGQELIKNSPRWSLVLEEILAKTSSAVLITSFSVISPTEAISVTGISASRSELNAFREELENSDWFKEVNLPLTNLELKNNLPFAMTFKIENVERLYQY
ncbi:MAG: hypothetical protein A3J48_00905 [Candidatus Doudnabacteria bacterium RIFCSPHIGHO2_02_FULL_46_11]|uniref:SHS2 domain-containing protein n=1 Tax=Candidatus Doudnabacteria bacterium RIFCSPHIGHO2_02_FULL_46_11 TaxID=1817832 RepID=A0A1F5P7I2_9BACT|nr:MAG: hypothetical protein A3J48_00905 [Candidatus Doudnabacteria bacterium RIFCSPHIGHO2_02_FULL_46_11]